MSAEAAAPAVLPPAGVGNDRVRPSTLTLASVAVAGTLAAVLTRIYTDLALIYIGQGLMFMATGLVAWWARPENRTGKLMILFGFLWWVPTEAQPISPLVFAITGPFQSAASVVLAYLLLSYPKGRLTSNVARAIFVFAVFRALWNNVFFLPFYSPQDVFGCTACPRNLLLWRSIPGVITASGQANPYLFGIQEVWIAAVLLARFVRGTRPARLVLGPMLVPAAILLLGDTVVSLFTVFALHYSSIFSPPPQSFTIPADVVRIAVYFLPLTFFIGLLLLRVRRGRVGEMVVHLGETAKPETVQQAVGRALGDPSAEVGFWLPEAERYVKVDGSPLVLPAEGSSRVVTRLERGGRNVAVVVHDAALLEDPGLIQAVGSAARLAVENDRLQAEVRAQLEEVRKSRTRILAAGDAERRRVERNLHDGAQQRLVSLSLALRMARDRAAGGRSDPELAALLDEASFDLAAALTELRELSQGLHPGVLSDEGLAAAIETLTERTPVPVSVEVPEERFPEQVEVTAYFVVSEALANAAKYSGASKAIVHVARETDGLRVEVADDGIGGADPRIGSGLRGLDDRVAAIDGRLRIESPPGRGTRITALLPCG
ncbi:MAG: sensor histidine kinase [Actinomycetota bacterium]